MNTPDLPVFATAPLDRRTALKRALALLGGVAATPSLLTFLQGCGARPGAGWKPLFLDDARVRLVTALAETIVPRTETPGAVDAGVPAFIDRFVAEVYDPAAQARFVERLAAFDAACTTAHGAAFPALDEERRLAALTTAHETARPFFLEIRELVLLGYFTSEPGATQVLQYQPVPGQYLPCVPLAEAGEGRTWAT